ncbi:hypothetical protein MESS2_880021 [Mesorhizobium metallidurans STM 2683]|uniref:Uncharacterized protein n=1 Tax=Mesorhizobium metallidurans STM 2683 TaxID=1297569 RepID=M5FBA0_9HYPH|nr:hypothetical protein MESS2_880021 [Mesorhizobium metallidurans STM 2683]
MDRRSPVAGCARVLARKPSPGYYTHDADHSASKALPIESPTKRNKIIGFGRTLAECELSIGCPSGPRRES